MSVKSLMATSRPRNKSMGSARENSDQGVSEDDALNATPVFSYKSTDFNLQVDPVQGIAPIPITNFEKELCRRWDQAKDEKAMNYKLNCIYKHLPGKFGLSAQLNIERAQLRRKPTPIKSMTDPFDHRRFNYTKIKFKEILLDMRCVDTPLTKDSLDRHLIVVNASPIEKAHSLAIPCVQRCQPQLATIESVRLSVHIMLLTASCRFHVVFNSLLAYASVNHLHFHMYYWPFLCDIVLKPVTHLFGHVHLLSAPDQWYTPAFVLQLNDAQHIQEFIENALEVLNYMRDVHVAHNIFMARAPPFGTPPADKMGKQWLVTMYIYPRQSVKGSKPPTNFNPAACELSGQLLIYTYRFFESMSEEGVKRIISDEASLPPDQFQALLSGLTQMFHKKSSSNALS